MALKELQSDARRRSAPGGSQRRKGDRIERELTSLLKDAGFAGARRQVASGSMSWIDPRFAGDVRTGAVVNGIELIGECKARKTGFARLRGWLNEPNVNFLYCRENAQAGIVAMHWSLFVQLLQLIPTEQRLPAPADKLADLREAAKYSPYAKQVLEKVQQFQKEEPLDEAASINMDESPEHNTPDTSSSVPF